MNFNLIKLPVLFFFLCVSILVIIYLQAPISSLKTAIIYTPIGSEKLRLAGLQEPHTPLNRISSFLVEFVILREGDLFYSHSGFNLFQIKDALEKKMKNRTLRGASTISQQLVKNIFFDASKTWLRKFLEAIYTLKLETELTKEEILS